MSRVLRDLGRSDLVRQGRTKLRVRSEDLVVAEYDKKTKTTLARLVDGSEVVLKLGPTALLRELPDRFERIGRYTVVDLERVEGISGREGRYQLHLEDWPEPVDVSPSAEKLLRRRLGLYTLDHPTPLPPSERALKEKGLIDFGYREYQALDPSDRKAVKAFKRRWDLRKFDSERIQKYFLEVTTGRVDVEKFIRNLLWQTYSWIKWGIEEPYEGNVRTFWYEVQAALSHHTDLIARVSPRSYNRALNEMIHDEGLFRYSDIGFFDVRSRYRTIGTKRPEVMLIGEKIGHFFRIKKLAEPLGLTYGSTKGQASHIMMEYFAQELADAGVDFDDWLHVFVITDFDWAGQSIARNFERLLKKNSGARKVAVHPLIRLEHFTDEEIEWGRTPAARYVIKRRQKIPTDGTTKRVLNAALEWFEEVQDPRLKSVENRGGKEVHVIWKVSVDTLDWDTVREVFRRRVQEVLDGEWSPLPIGFQAHASLRPRGSLDLEDELLEEDLELDPFEITEEHFD